MDPGVLGPAPSRRGHGEWSVRVQRQALQQPHRDCLRNRRHPLVGSGVLWAARWSQEAAEGGGPMSVDSSKKRRRCAVYTRKSMGEGLNQEFNGRL